MATTVRARKRKKKEEPVNPMFQELERVIEQVSRDRSIPKERLIAGIETAFLSAARKKWGHLGDLEAHYNTDTGEIELFQFKEVVETVDNAYVQMTPKEALDYDPDAQVGDSIGVKMDPRVFGRIAAQTAKQVIIQQMRDAERDIVYEEFKDRVGEIVTGIVRRFERGDMIIDLGRTEAVIPRSEQIPSEHYRVGERVQGYFARINREGRGPQVVLSRRDPALVCKLFETEVPEIAEGIVQIRITAREPGVRTKIGVYSRDSDVDPVGACVGMKGSRVQSVVQELRGEKIDIIQWDEDPARFVCNALSPAEVVKVIIRERDHSMEVVVPDDHLSLAIGRKGQNVRLAAELTGWSIDVFSETKVEELAARQRKALQRVLEVDDATALILHSHTYRTVEELLSVGEADFARLPGMGEEFLKGLYAKARAAVDSGFRTETLVAEFAAADAAAKAQAEAEAQAEAAALAEAKAKEEAEAAAAAPAPEPEPAPADTAGGEGATDAPASAGDADQVVKEV